MEKFPEQRVHDVLGGLADTQKKILDEFARAIDVLTSPA